MIHASKVLFNKMVLVFIWLFSSSLLGLSSAYIANCFRIDQPSRASLSHDKKWTNFNYVQVQKLSSKMNSKLNESSPGLSKISEKVSPELPFIKLGDIVRYYDLDGGQEKGQILVGKATYVYEKLASDLKEKNGSKEWNVEIEELEDMGQGHYSENSSRNARQVVRNLKDLSPVMATYERSSDSYKISKAINPSTGKMEPLAIFERYNLDGFEVPTKKPIVAQEVQHKTVEIRGDVMGYALFAGLAAAVLLLVQNFKEK